MNTINECIKLMPTITDWIDSSLSSHQDNKPKLLFTFISNMYKMKEPLSVSNTHRSNQNFKNDNILIHKIL